MEYKKIEFDKKFADDYFKLSSVLNVSDNNKQDNNSSDNTSNSTKKNTTDTNNNSTTTNNNETNNSTENNSNNNSNEENNTTNSTNDANSTTEDDSKKTENTATIDDIIYPMYLPTNTYLTNQQTIDTDTGERLILTFGGDSSFTLVEETSVVNDSELIIPVSGDIEFLTDVVGVVGDNSVTWDSNGIEYYLVSDTLETSELISIAQSLSVLPVSK